MAYITNESHEKMQNNQFHQWNSSEKTLIQRIS